jgi:hypothetical protein
MPEMCFAIYLTMQTAARSSVARLKILRMDNNIFSAIASAQPKRAAIAAFLFGKFKSSETMKALPGNVGQFSGHGDLLSRLPCQVAVERLRVRPLRLL